MNVRFRACLFVSIALHLFTGRAFAQDALVRVKQKMADSLGGARNFMCSVSVERTLREGSGGPNALAPLRVEAGVIDGKEVYALPSTPAGVVALREILTEYTSLGSGSVALYARPVFLTGMASYHAAPEESKEGRRLLRWDFRVPRRYKLTNNGQQVVAGYSGTFWADAATLDVVRLELRPDDLPPAFGIKSAVQTIDYGRGGIGLLLPTASELVVTEAGGRETRVLSRFENCRKYPPKSTETLVEAATTTSKLSGRRTYSPKSTETLVEAASKSESGPAPAPAAMAATPGARMPFPARTTLELTLEAPIDERTTAVNDKVSFKVGREIKKDGKVLVPRGALAVGRITRISRHSYRIAYRISETLKGYYIVGIELNSMEAGEQRFRLAANLETVGPTTDKLFFIPFSHDPDKWGRFNRDAFNIPKAQGGESILGIVREYLRLPKGLRTQWITTEAVQ